MIKSSKWHFRYITGKVMMGLILFTIISSVNVAPSYGDDYYRRGRGDHDRYEHRDHDRYRHGRWHDRGRYRYYDDGYREIIYVAPPPVYYPPPSPGIGIFFPPIVIRP